MNLLCLTAWYRIIFPMYIKRNPASGICPEKLVSSRFQWLAAALVVAIALVGCRAPAETTPLASSIPSETAAQTPDNTPINAETPTPVPLPTATPVPLAAVVNGMPITLAAFDAHLHRLLDALEAAGTELAPQETANLALNDLIDQSLLAQGAAAAGFEIEEALLEERIASLTVDVGGAEQLEVWMGTHHYTEESFRQDLADSIAAAWMRDRIAGTVPSHAEQIHARQIFLLNQADAQTVLERIQNGVDFDALAQTYDPQGFGELGWFPEGYLTEPAVEAAAFSLQVDEVSGVIETGLGYHIVKVIERQPDRPLEPDALLTLQLQALASWLSNEREQGQIQILLPEFNS